MSDQGQEKRPKFSVINGIKHKKREHERRRGWISFSLIPIAKVIVMVLATLALVFGGVIEKWGGELKAWIESISCD